MQSGIVVDQATGAVEVECQSQQVGSFQSTPTLVSLIVGTEAAGQTATIAVDAAVNESDLVTLRKAGSDRWSLYLPASDGRLFLFDWVNVRGQVALTPGAAGVAKTTFQDRLQVESASGQQVPAFEVLDHVGAAVLQVDAEARKFGAFGAAMVGQQTLPPPATDAASTQALANALRSVLIALGYCV